MGFADQAHMQRAFKAHHALTPGNYAQARSAEAGWDGATAAAPAPQPVIARRDTPRYLPLRTFAQVSNGQL
jgi:AraC-like DNA-binding protein